MTAAQGKLDREEPAEPGWVMLPAHAGVCKVCGAGISLMAHCLVQGTWTRWRRAAA